MIDDPACVRIGQPPVQLLQKDHSLDRVLKGCLKRQFIRNRVNAFFRRWGHGRIPPLSIDHVMESRQPGVPGNRGRPV